ncbi:tetratricopeptide repeat protein [Sphingobium bisphenolivorans]|uniref:tetratricopeptide repeat protein n=1 Tax=Sphingobium bisphenolivorans TaxID=1335760 RepID=UPI00187CF662|nr:tetratricopeptide repeat protein [Sphingobium bisphenolivorans]
MLPIPAGASVDRGSALHAYMRGRLADGDGAPALALRSYRDALESDPDSLEIARRSYVHGLISGDMALALRSARILDGGGHLPRDGTLLYICDALNRRDWTAARGFVDRMVTESNFAFLAPVVRSWIAIGEGKHGPLSIDASDRFASLGRRYLDEHVALQALSSGYLQTAQPAINQALALKGRSGAETRLLFAGHLAARGKIHEALALLPADDADFARARADIASREGLSAFRKPLAAREGFARLLYRLADDISLEGSTAMLSVRLSRIALFADMASPSAHIIAAKMLTRAALPAFGLEEARKAAAAPWYRGLAETEMIDALDASGNRQQAIELARARAEEQGADGDRQVRLGQLLSEGKDFSGAATAFRAAQASHSAGSLPWALLLLEGSALEQAGRWDDARAVLEQAHRLAPDEPVVLNYLGYAQIERRQNVEAALELLKKASLLKPDDPSITDSLGWAQFLTGDVDAAVPVLERAAAAAPTDATINEHLGDALWAAGRRYEARYAWRAASLFAEGKAAERLAGKNKEGMRPEYAAR